MTVIEKNVHAQFASLAQQNTTSVSEPAPSNRGQASRGEERIPQRTVPLLAPPFARVDAITTGSPAAEAGLKVGDEIRAFGYVNRENNDSLRRVADCVQVNEGVRALLPNSFHSENVTIELS